MIEKTITLGNIIEILSILGGGVFFLFRQQLSFVLMRNQITTMQKEIEKISEIIIDNAVRDQRLLNIEQDIRDLQRGKGYVSEDVSGEYTKHGKIVKKYD